MSQPPWIQEEVHDEPQPDTPKTKPKATKHNGRFQAINTFVDTQMRELSRSLNP